MNATRFQGFTFTFKSEALWILIVSIELVLLALLIAILLRLLERTYKI